MEQIKHQRNNSFNHYNDKQKKKTEVTTVQTKCLSKEPITYFEDLSNEVIYIIFEFLDNFHVYKGFFNLNIRFYNLLINSNLPIQINISFMPKSTFKQYYKDIIVTNMHRINSFRLVNRIMFGRIFSPNCIVSKFHRLERLILNNIKPKYLENFVHELISLPYLSSLSIYCLDAVRNKTSVCQQIFRLPALKYCKLSLGNTWFEAYPILLATTHNCSPIEHLIINNSLNIDELNSLLSYVPQLRRLSIGSLHNTGLKRIKGYSLVLNHLTHVYLELDPVTFDQFEQIVRDFFTTVQVLSISTYYRSDQAFMDANRWEQLIRFHMPNLRIFDIQHQNWPINIAGNFDETNQLTFNTRVKQFTSSFWSERQWFFTQQHKSRMDCTIFYSTNPYRRKHYTLYKQENNKIPFSGYRINLKSVRHVHIESEEAMMGCGNYFSNATKVTFEHTFSITHDPIAKTLNYIIPVKQLTELASNGDHFSFINMIELLCFTPNVHTLDLRSIPVHENDYISIRQSEKFRLASGINTITNMTCMEKCTLEKLQLLVALCPQLQHLAVDTCTEDLESITRFLLEKTNHNTRSLFSLCFSIANNNWVETLNALIKSETLLDNYTIKLDNYRLHLWW